MTAPSGSTLVTAKRAHAGGLQAAGPVALVLCAALVLWYGGALLLNRQLVRDRLENAGTPLTAAVYLREALALERPVLPAPHQIAQALWQSLSQNELDSPRNLLFHAAVTLSATLPGFALGLLFGVLLAVGVVHDRVLARGLLPWIIASQTVPVLAIAPMVIVVMGALGAPPLLSKALISAYLSFFPVAVGMVKGLRSPEVLQLDLLRTYSASRLQVLLFLRLPDSVPFLFASSKVAITAALIGAIVGELPTGAQAGLGARLLSGSYFGQTVQLWAALVMASLLGVALVACVGVLQKWTSRRMGARP
jgi:NitT/TauT family transport system permease protein